MNRDVLALCAAAALAMPITALAEPLVLSPNGYGLFRLGMRAEGSGTWLEGKPTPGCYGGYSREHAGIHLVFEHDRLTRIAVRGVQGIETARGVHIGSTEDDLTDAYGSQLIVTASASFPPPGKTLTVWFHHREQGIRFDTDTSGRVVSMIAGTPSVMRGAGCP
jgi:hypothetical protein